MYYAEENTDRYIRETFFPNFDYKGTMVEVGAGPAVFLSMSKHFRDNGWRCICVEPNPKFANQHRQLGHEIYEYAASFEEKDAILNIVSNPWWPEEHNGVSFSSLELKYTGWDDPSNRLDQIAVKTIKLNTLLENLNVEKIDFLSIDVEGYELEVMRGFDAAKYQPKVILLEIILDSKQVDWTPYYEYMNSIGYKIFHRITHNHIFTLVE